MSNMNPYIRQRVERYSAVVAEIEQMQTRAVNEHRDLTEDELRSAQTQADQAKKLHEEIAPFLEEYERGEAVRSLAAQMEPRGDEDEPFAALQMPRLMPSAAQMELMARSVTGDNPHPVRLTTAYEAPHTRAAVTLAGTGTPAKGFQAPSFLPDPRRIAVASGMPVEFVAGAENMVFPVFGAGTAGLQTEGGAKTEYAAITPGTAAPKMLNAYTDFTRQVALSHGSFEQRLKAKLATLVAAREDVLIQTKVAATVGIQTQAFAAGAQASQVLVGAAKVESAVGQPPDLLLCNPADVGLLFGAGLANTPPGELAELRLDLFGMKVYATTAQTQGFVLAGAWRAGARMVIGMQPTWFVDPYTGLKTNVITALLEEAVDIAVDTPEAFINVDIVTP